MDEEIKQPTKQEVRTNEIQEAKKLLESIKEEKLALQEQMKLREEQKAEDMISGESEGGSIPPVVDKEKEEKDAINAWLEPSGQRID